MAEKQQLSAMLLELRARCPTLCPAVVPSGCDDRESGTAMLALSRDAQERQALVSLLSSARRAAAPLRRHGAESEVLRPRHPDAVRHA